MGVSTGSDPMVLPRARLQACVAGLERGRGAVGDLELEQHLGDVVAQGLVRHAEADGDLMVAAAGGQQRKDVSFAGGELGAGDHGGRGWWWWRRAGASSKRPSGAGGVAWERGLRAGGRGGAAGRRGTLLRAPAPP